MSTRILVVDDDADIVRTAERILQRQKYETMGVGSAAAALELLQRDSFDLLLSDVSMPGMDGLELLAAVRKTGDAIPVVMMSGTGTIEIAVKALQLGAHDFVQKPVEVERMIISVRNALQVVALAAENRLLQADAPGSEELVGGSPAMARLRALIQKVAPSDGRILILGENGTGKELVASAIHRASQRRDNPFIKLNCGAVPDNLVESELFGHEKGAFTGAATMRKGRFELADGGTLFLDEIGDMPLPMQVKLLRVLQEGQLERVGGARTISVDVRLLAATNRNLEEMVEQGIFREDLYYRLNVVSLVAPPLRERTGDIPQLVERFLERMPGHARLDEGAMRALERHDYPGNVRELKNLIERILILHADEVVGAADLEAMLSRRRPEQGNGKLYREGVGYRDLVHELERRVLAESLEAHAGNKGAAATALQIERSFFYRKCRQLGVGEDD